MCKGHEEEAVCAKVMTMPRYVQEFIVIILVHPKANSAPI